MSFLIIRCPNKPSQVVNSTQITKLYSECNDLFEWYLIENLTTDVVLGSGVGSIELMPYADEALVVMPGIDVRFIEANVPLVSPKKLQQILPNLIEDAVLSGVDQIASQVLPPLLGSPALQRTIVLIDQLWLTWLSKQLANLLSPQVRLIPESLLLSSQEQGAEVVGYQIRDGCIYFSKRTLINAGVAWIEYLPTQDHNFDNLPQSLRNAKLIELNGQWLLSAGQRYLQENGHSKSANYALNLLPNTFRSQNLLNKHRSIVGSVIAWLSPNRVLTANFRDAKWTDTIVWRAPLRWSVYVLAAYALGLGAYLGWMRIDDWRWVRQMHLLAGSALNPLTLATLTRTVDAAKTSSILDAFVQQSLQEQRRDGFLLDADFAPMVSKLQQLKNNFGADVLQAIEYDGLALTFEFKSSAGVTSAQVLNKADALGFAVQSLGQNRYRLLAFSGLGTQ